MGISGSIDGGKQKKQFTCITDKIQYERAFAWFRILQKSLNEGSKTIQEVQAEVATMKAFPAAQRVYPVFVG